jgi:hypothetical protein
MFQTNAAGENKKAHFMFNNVFSKIVPFGYKVENQCSTRQATDENMAHAHCMLDT